METQNKPTLGKPLLFEFLPDIKFRYSHQGVLFALFDNGDCFFYPLNDQTKGNQPTSARMLTQEPTRKKNENGQMTTKQQENNRYFVYDVSLSLNADLYRVASWNFNSKDPPRKVLLSPNKRLLLLLGAPYKNNSCLLVYQIIEDGVPEFFRLIFFDFSFPFIDVCFSPDSKGLVVIPTRFPTLLFILSLPMASQKSNGIFSNSNHSSFSNISTSHLPSNMSMDEFKTILQRQQLQQNSSGLPERSLQEQQGLLQYEARKTGPLVILGPGKGLFGHTIKMSHVASNPNPAEENGGSSFDFVTWNDDFLGEFVLWNIHKDSFQFRYVVKSVVPRQTEDDYDWSPKCWILDMQFSNREQKLMAVIKREHRSKMKSENGIGLQMMNLQDENQNNSQTNSNITNSQNVYWYHVSDSMDTSSVLCAKWTSTLLIGQTHAAAVMIRGKGIFEMVDFRFTSSFQDMYETFVNEGCNFVQVGRFNRFWLNHNGVLRVMVVTPQSLSSHPEWPEIEKANKMDLLNMRVLGKRIGYYINVLEKDPIDYSKKRTKEKLPDSVVLGKGDLERFVGLHLFRCCFCRRILLKPLQCSRCKSVCYCSRNCQKSDWERIHKQQCKLN